MLKKDELRHFGQDLLKMRKSKHMTQMQLADVLDVDYRQISRYETGEAEMGSLLYDKMLRVFGQKTDDPHINDLLQQFAGLTPENQQRVINFAMALNITQKQA